VRPFEETRLGIRRRGDRRFKYADAEEVALRARCNVRNLVVISKRARAY